MKTLLALVGAALLLGLAGCEVEAPYGGGYSVYGEYGYPYYGGTYVAPYYGYRYYGPYDRDHYWDRDRHWEQHRWHGDRGWGHRDRD